MVMDGCKATVDNFYGITDPWKIPAPVLLFTPQKTHRLFWDLTFTYIVGNTWLTARATNDHYGYLFSVLVCLFVTVIENYAQSNISSP
jgi:hypothetical protein